MNQLNYTPNKSQHVSLNSKCVVPLPPHNTQRSILHSSNVVSVGPQKSSREESFSDLTKWHNYTGSEQ